MKRFLFFTVVVVFMLALSVCASTKLSPAIDVIANDFSMVKSTVANDGEFIFDINDFDLPLGVNVQSITITSLPSTSVGRLMLDNLYVVESQVISRDDFSMLKFVKTATESIDAVFKFKPNDNEYEIECSIKELSQVNLSPVVSNGESVSAWTNMNISCYEVLSGYDPDGDKLRYEITSYPEKGLLVLTNTETGDYIYTPYEDASGTDAFSYRVRDEYGNYSESCTVKMKIEKLKTSLVFSDLDDDRCLNAVIAMHDNELMTFKKNKDGSYSFRPNEEITRLVFSFSIFILTVQDSE